MFAILFMLYLSTTNLLAKDSYESFIDLLIKSKISQVTYQGLHFERAYNPNGSMKKLIVSDSLTHDKEYEVWEQQGLINWTYLYAKQNDNTEILKKTTEDHLGPLGIKNKIIHSSPDEQGNFQHKIEYEYLISDVIETRYKQTHSGWEQVHKITMPKFLLLPPACDPSTVDAVNSCRSSLRNFYTLGFTDFLDFMHNAATTQCTSGTTIKSGLGFLIDAQSCSSDEQIREITEAIETMYTDQNIRCLMTINRTMMRDLLATIQRNQPRIVCGGSMAREEFHNYSCSTNRTDACIQNADNLINQAGAFQAVGSNDLVLMGMTPGAAYYESVPQNTQALASTVMHELMHLAGHCQDATVHNSNRFDDEVFGCTALCSNHRLEKKMTSREACQRCIDHGNHSNRPDSRNCSIYPAANDRTIFQNSYNLGLTLHNCLAALSGGTSPLNVNCRNLQANPQVRGMCGTAINWDTERQNTSSDGCFNRIRRWNYEKISQVRDRYFAQRNTGAGQHGEHWQQFLKTQTGDFRLAQSQERRRRLELDWTDSTDYQSMRTFTSTLLSYSEE